MATMESQAAGDRDRVSSLTDSPITTPPEDRICPLPRWTDPCTGEVNYLTVGADLGLAARTEIVTTVRLQWHDGEELLAEVAFTVTDAAAEPGESLDWPALVQLLPDPPGRLTATLNPELPAEIQASWARLLDWPAAPPLRVPVGARRLSIHSFPHEDQSPEDAAPLPVVVRALLPPDLLPPLPGVAGDPEQELSERSDGTTRPIALDGDARADLAGAGVQGAPGPAVSRDADSQGHVRVLSDTEGDRR